MAGAAKRGAFRFSSSLPHTLPIASSTSQDRARPCEGFRGVLVRVALAILML